MLLLDFFVQGHIRVLGVLADRQNLRFHALQQQVLLRQHLLLFVFGIALLRLAALGLGRSRHRAGRHAFGSRTTTGQRHLGQGLRLVRLATGRRVDQGDF